ncbi:prepilin peptidase [Halobellus limi]|uniref:Preflagellin peptidase FlaK n=1 Tax=Halobellus limi TaxID=699433 RepID=A0A1H5WPS0_9EURY|nr:A24 family peptidase C-terminal domain-containing protein [Halobellus limi]QCC46374.1 prepilin peptidase [Halobellus limi]SEG01331.1 preflagellin peptidase FlaK [Halobellus limi]
MFASVPDLLRLAVLPVLGWAAWRDIETRRVSTRTWYPLVGLGLLLLAWESVGHLSLATSADVLFFVRVAISLFLVAPIAYGFWWIGGFGGADAKALIAIAILLPTFPTYYFMGFTLPEVVTTLGVFSMTILTNTVVLAAGYPLALGVRNVLDGDVRFPVSFLGTRVGVADLATAHGRLYETPEGFSRNGLDIDALRMYLRWRGLSLDELRSDPDRFRDPGSVGETYDPTDGAVDVGGDDASVDSAEQGDGESGGSASPGGDAAGVESDGGVARESDGGSADSAADADDPWAAEAFLDSIEGSAYGTSPEKLRGGLDVLAEREEIWISPGIPFLVPIFVGTLAAFTYGDVVFGALEALSVL